jgi:hypothetical protein
MLKCLLRHGGCVTSFTHDTDIYAVLDKCCYTGDSRLLSTGLLHHVRSRLMKPEKPYDRST